MLYYVAYTLITWAILDHTNRTQRPTKGTKTMVAIKLSRTISNKIKAPIIHANTIKDAWGSCHIIIFTTVKKKICTKNLKKIKYNLGI